MKYINFDKKHFDKCVYMKVNGVFTFVAYKKLKNGLYRLAAGDINASNFKLTNLGNYELKRVDYHNVDWRNGFSKVEYFFNSSIGEIPLNYFNNDIPFEDLKKIDTNLLALYLTNTTNKFNSPYFF